jgi:hypothetical protein
LSHIISGEGIVVDLVKFKAIMEWPVPKMCKKYSRILPTILRIFFEDSKSDHEIAKEKQEVRLEEKCAEAFKKLKDFLTKELILKVPDMEKEFLVCIDTSKEGVGRVLMQDDQLIP